MVPAMMGIKFCVPSPFGAISIHVHALGDACDIGIYRGRRWFCSRCKSLLLAPSGQPLALLPKFIFWLSKAGIRLEWGLETENSNCNWRLDRTAKEVPENAKVTNSLKEASL